MAVRTNGHTSAVHYFNSFSSVDSVDSSTMDDQSCQFMTELIDVEKIVSYSNGMMLLSNKTVYL